MDDGLSLRYDRDELDSKSASPRSPNYGKKADLAWIRKRWPTRFVVRAVRERQGYYDQGLEQHFVGTDVKAFRNAKAYADELTSSGTAMSASVEAEAEFPPFFFVGDRNIGGWHMVASGVYRVEAGATEIELAEEALRDARRRGTGVWEAEKHLRNLREGKPRGVEGLMGRSDDVRWLALAQSIVVEFKIDDVARAAAAENAEQAECIPGSYERHHLNWDEYGSSQAANDLEYALLGAIAAHDLHDFDTEKVQDYVMREVRESFFDPYVRELKKLRPDLRECGDDGDGIDGLEGRRRKYRLTWTDRKGELTSQTVTGYDRAAALRRELEADTRIKNVEMSEEGSAMKGLKGVGSNFKHLKQREDALIATHRGGADHDLFEEVVASMASMMFNIEYASAWERALEDGETDVELPRRFDFDPPEEIVEGAQSILRAAIGKSGISLRDLVARYDEKTTGKGGADTFGHDLGCDWVGAGCSDSGMQMDRELGFDIGDGELVLFLVDGDPETVEINYFAGTGLSAKRTADVGGVGGLDAGRRGYSNAEYAKDRPDSEYIREVKEVVRMIGKARADKIVKYLDGKIPVEPGVDPYYVHRFRQIHKMIGGPKMRAIMDGRWD